MVVVVILGANILHLVDAAALRATLNRAVLGKLVDESASGFLKLLVCYIKNHLRRAR